MGKKLYVGNLSFNSSEQDLEDVFAEFGTVESVNIIEDRDTGRSRGFGTYIHIEYTYIHIEYTYYI